MLNGKQVSEMSMGDIQRLVAREVARQLPAIPAQVAKLDHHQRPLVRPDVATDGHVLTYSRDMDDWVPIALPTAPTVTDPTVIAPVGETWNVRIVPVTIDPPSLNASLGQTITVTISGLLAGDQVLYIGHDANNNSQIFHMREPICVTPGQVDMGQFNPDTVAINVASATFYFLVINIT